MDQLAPVRSKTDTFPVSLPLRYLVPSVEGSKLSQFSDDPYLTENKNDYPAMKTSWS